MSENTSSSSESVVERESELVEQPATDVVPLPRTTNGRSGTTKRGKTVTTKTGNPADDKSAARAQRSPAAAPATSTSKSTPSSSKSASAQPAPASDTPKRAARGELAVVRSRKSRVTGTLVEIVNTTAADSKLERDEKTPWAAHCVDHAHVERFVTRAAARAVASDPSSWCRKCRSAAAKTAQ